MRRLFWIIAVTGLLSACMARTDAIYVGWHCVQEQPNTEWQCTQRRLRAGQPVDDGETGSAATSTAEPAPTASEPPVEVVGDSASVADGAVAGAAVRYTIQLGAFASAEAAREFIAATGLPGLTTRLQVVPGGGSVYRVTYGSFASPQEARSAWAEVTAHRGAQKPWFRPLESAEQPSD